MVMQIKLIVVVVVVNIGHFPSSFLGNLSQEKVFYDILDRTNVFPGFKNKNF